MSSPITVEGSFGPIPDYGIITYSLNFTINNTTKIVSSITGTMTNNFDTTTDFLVIPLETFENNDNEFYQNQTSLENTFFNSTGGLGFFDSSNTISYLFTNDNLGNYLVKYSFGDPPYPSTTTSLLIQQTCILRGMKILTTTGEIKIEKVTLEHEIKSGNGKIYKIRRILQLPYGGEKSNPCKIELDGKIVYLSKDHSIKYNGEWLSAHQRGINQITNNELKELIDMEETIYFHVELESNESRRDMSIIVNGIEIEPFSNEKLI